MLLKMPALIAVEGLRSARVIRALNPEMKLELEFVCWRPEDIQSFDVPTMVMIGMPILSAPNTQWRCSVCSQMPKSRYSRALATIRFRNAPIGCAR